MQFRRIEGASSSTSSLGAFGILAAPTSHLGAR